MSKPKRNPKTAETYPAEITTAELSRIVSVETETDVSPKQIRVVLREIIPDDRYTRYRFPYPSAIVNRIIERFRQVEAERSERSKRAADNRKRRTERKPDLIDLDDNGNLITVGSTETETDPETDNVE